MHFVWLTIILIFLNLLFAGSLIFIERKNPTTTWAWLMIFILLPGLGFVIYLLLGQNFSRQKLFKDKSVTDANTRKNNIANSNMVLNEEELKYLDLIKMNYTNSGARYTQRNEIEIFSDGKEKFEKLLEDIENAKKYIHIQYYIFKNDEIGNKIIEALEKKLDDGVKVRLLVDAMGSWQVTKKKLRTYLNKGGKFSIFFPGILPHINTRINYRNHRKIVVIDGEYGYVGGFNVGDEYLSRDKKIGNWRDTHIRIRGKAVEDLDERFILDWCYAADEKVEDIEKSEFEDSKSIGDVSVQIVTSGPDHNEEYIKNGYVKMINNAKKDIYLTTPYFVPDVTMIESLRISALSGVNVNILIPGNPDHKFMQWAANSYIGELLDAGARVFHYNKGFVHAKVLSIDGCVSSIGTANMDIRSFSLNFEVNAFIYNFKVANEIEEQFKKDLEDSTEITREIYQNRGRISKILESIVKLLSPIL
ncbi:cardiolipin synthase [uncultured Clostridium sp.]|uniref:cardiolipin synthase n=1 Tax=uncultured Clostridium sp. TaxID=59620 RepID=UPI00261D0BA8|nr:cardiolipin synthase [uncultured Clostridium sp.]